MSVPSPLRAGLLAVIALTGIGVGGVVVAPAALDAYTEHKYIQLIAQDAGTSAAVKLAMVMAAYYESSFSVRLVPYHDELSSKRPLTVCNGITDVGMPRGFPSIQPGRTYRMDECYAMERALFVGYETRMPALVPAYHAGTMWQQAAQLDFVHHFGINAFRSSTMRRRINAGDVAGACAEHARWKYTTLPSGAKTVLAGLKVRADANAELCAVGVGL